MCACCETHRFYKYKNSLSSFKSNADIYEREDGRT